MTTTLAASVLWTLGTVAALGLALRLRARPWIAFLIWLLPTVVLVLDFERQTLSAHGLFHASIVYDILERGAPPGHPLLGGPPGDPLRYPWAHHAIAAAAARLLGMTPAAVFGATGLLSLILFGFFLDRAAREIDADARYRVLAVALALFGSNPFTYGPLASALTRAGVPLEPRAVPWVKFAGVNSNHLGLMLTALVLLALLRIAASERPGRSPYVLAGAAMLGSAFLYPMSFLTNGVWLGATAAWLALRQGPSGRARAFRLLAAATVGTLPALPYLWLVSAGRSAAGALQVAPSPGYALRHLAILGVALVLPLLLIAAVRPGLNRDGRTTVLILCAAAAQAVFVLGFLSTLVAYKFLMASMLPLGLLAAAPLRRLAEMRPLPALACLLLLFLPMGMGMGRAVTEGWPAAQPLTHRGAYLEPLDPAERGLYRWIAERTPKEALFVDDRLTVPPFGRRRLFVALTQAPPPSGTHDGWGMSSELILGGVTGADTERAERRRQIALELLVSGTRESLERLREEAGESPVYVIARDDKVAARMTGLGLRPVYPEPAVYLIPAPGYGAAGAK
ncbi:MAG: hypothetical protein ABUT39_14145 [Acidobacteriota bacterium]